MPLSSRVTVPQSTDLCIAVIDVMIGVNSISYIIRYCT